MSRILNNSLDLKCERFKTGIEKDEFVSKIISIDGNLGNLFKNERFLQWIKQLRINRHFTAHQGSIILSPLVEAPESEPSDEELEKEAESTRSWSFFKAVLSSEMFEHYRALLKQNIRMSKYKILHDDTMVMQDGEKRFIFRPLINIEWDFSNFELITLSSLQALYEVLKKKQVKQ